MQDRQRVARKQVELIAGVHGWDWVIANCVRGQANEAEAATLDLNESARCVAAQVKAARDQIIEGAW